MRRGRWRCASRVVRGSGGAPSGQCESSSGDTRPVHERCGPALTSPEPDTSKMFNPVPEPCASSVTRVDAYPVSSACAWYTSRITISVPSRRKLTCGGVRTWRRQRRCAQPASRRATVRGGAGGGGGGGARLAKHGPRRHDDLVVPLVRAHAVGVLGDPLLLLEDRRALAAHVELLRMRRQREREDGGRPAGGHHARRPAARAPHGGLRWLRDSQRASSRAPWYATALRSAQTRSRDGVRAAALNFIT